MTIELLSKSKSIPIEDEDGSFTIYDIERREVLVYRRTRLSEPRNV